MSDIQFMLEKQEKRNEQGQHATITVRYGGKDWHGESGHRNETRENMHYWQDLCDAFDNQVKEARVTNKDGFDEMRPWNQCAEPNALSRLVRDKVQGDSGGVGERLDLAEVRYPECAKYKTEDGRDILLKPCTVCSKWLEQRGSGLVINNLFKKAQESLNRRYYERKYRYLINGYRFARETDLTMTDYRRRCEFIGDHVEKLKAFMDSVPRGISLMFAVVSEAIFAGIKTYRDLTAGVGKLRDAGDNSMATIDEIRMLPVYRNAEKHIDFTGSTAEEKIQVLERARKDLQNLSEKIRFMREETDCGKVGSKIIYKDYMLWDAVASLVVSIQIGSRNHLIGLFHNKPLKGDLIDKYTFTFNRFNELEQYFRLMECSKENVKDLLKFGTEDNIARYRETTQQTNKMSIEPFIAWCKTRH